MDGLRGADSRQLLVGLASVFRRNSRAKWFARIAGHVLSEYVFNVIV